MSNNFQTLGLSKPMVQELSRQGIGEPFPIQAQAIPPALDGRDIQGRAPTGSGKTLAFGLPVLSRVAKANGKRPRALVLVPTRELAEQIRRDLAPIAGVADRRIAAIYGGVSYGPQKKALSRGVDVLVATPGRLEDLIEQRHVDLAEVDIVVLDEADRMADMGFLPAVRRIIDMTGRERQMLLFSATLDGDIAVLSRQYQNQPVAFSVEAVGVHDLDLEHHFWSMAKPDRVVWTEKVIGASGRTIVFTRTRHGADRLMKQLGRSGISAVALHGGRSQNQRTRALKAFGDGRASALVATDVAARGIHVEDIDVVVHFDPPNDHKDYLHRSGRTARAGAAGTVITLVAEGQEREVRKTLRQTGLEIAVESPSLGALQRSGSGDRVPKGRAPKSRVSNGRVPKARDDESMKLYVGNLPWRITDRDLEALFAEYGQVEKATISTQRKSGRSKGYGFVVMPVAHGNVAITAMNGTKVKDRAIRVRPAY